MSSSILNTPTSWDSYYIVFLSAVLALGLPLGLFWISRVFSKFSSNSKFEDSVVTTEAPSLDVSRSPVDHTVLGRRMNPRVFLAVNVALALIALVLILIPSVVAFQAGTPHDEIARSLTAVISLGIFAGLGLLYAVKKGDLSWLRTFRRPE